MASRGARVTIVIDTEGMAEKLRSDEAKAVLEEQARKLAEEKTNGAAAHLQGKMPASGLYGYHMHLGKKSWRATIFPKNRAAYAIGAKHGVKNL